MDYFVGLKRLLLATLLMGVSCPLWAGIGLQVAPSAIDFGSSLDPAFSPFDLSSPVRVTVDNTEPGPAASWTLSVKAADEFKSVSSPSDRISASQLSYMVNGASPYANITTANVEIASGTEGTFTYTLDYRLAIYLTNTALSDYKTTLVYTLIGL